MPLKRSWPSCARRGQEAGISLATQGAVQSPRLSISPLRPNLHDRSPPPHRLRLEASALGSKRASHDPRAATHPSTTRPCASFLPLGSRAGAALACDQVAVRSRSDRASWSDPSVRPSPTPRGIKKGALADEACFAHAGTPLSQASRISEHSSVRMRSDPDRQARSTRSMSPVSRHSP